MKTLVLADRLEPALAPFTSKTCLAMLPVVGKPLLEHTLEDLAGSGLRTAAVVVSPHAKDVEQQCLDGAQWGLSLDYRLVQEGQSAESTILAAAVGNMDELLVARGDVLRSPCVAKFLEAAAKVDRKVIVGTSNGRAVGLYLLRPGLSGKLSLPGKGDLLSEQGAHVGLVELPGVKVSWLENAKEFHAANLQALRGDFPGLILPARKVTEKLHVGRQSRVSIQGIVGGPVFIGSRCVVEPTAEIDHDVIISDGVFVDRRATLRSVIVLPQTYVGELVELENAIVWGTQVFKIDSASAVTVTDRFLLADLRTESLADLLAEVAGRVTAAALLVLALPLWALGLIFSVLKRPFAPLQGIQLLGNRTRRDADGGVTSRFRKLELATGIPVLKHLPGLISVIRGDLRLVGVSPLTPEESASRTAEWELERDRSPVGLIGPAQLALDPGASGEERWVLESYYANARSLSEDFNWLLAGLRALASRRAWLAPRASAERKALPQAHGAAQQTAPQRTHDQVPQS